MKHIHFMYCPFTGLGLYGGYRGDTWLRNRIALFNRFVVPSLVSQTNKNFLLWLTFRPEEEHNPIVKQFIANLNNIRGLATVVTYHGILFYDDKYDDQVAKMRLMNSLEATLPELKDLVADYSHVMMTIQPSDDIYLSTAVDDIQASLKHHNLTGWTKGYIMNYETLDIAKYNPSTNPPFFTIKFPTKIFLDPLKHFEYTGPYQSHEYVVDHVTPATKLTDRGFIVGTHGENTSTTWSHGFRGRVLSKEEADGVLIKAGLFDVKPLVVKKDAQRLRRKRLLNLLPSSWQRTIVRQLSPGVNESIKSYKYFNL